MVLISPSVTNMSSETQLHMCRLLSDAIGFPTCCFMY